MRIAKGKTVGRGPALAGQGDGAGVARQAVEGGAVEAGEGFQLVQSTGVVEDFGVHLDGGMRRVATGAARGVLLEVGGVRRAVGTQEEFGAAAGGGFDQRQAVGFALEHRQAVVVRADAAGEDGVAVVQQVLGGEGGGGEVVGIAHVLGSFARGDVLKHNFQRGEVAAQRDELLVDEGGFAVEQIDVGAGDLTMHQQQHVGALHGFQRLVDLAQVGHACVAVGGGTGGIELGGYDACGLGTGDLVGGQAVGEVQGHQRVEGDALGHGGQDALAVGQGLGGAGHGRAQVGHDDGAAKLGGGVRHHGVQGLAIAHVQVPVVGAGDGESGGGS